MKEEYIIISKTAIQKRIEELEKQRDNEHKKGHDKSALRYENTILELKQILSQSTPLIPEIERSFIQGERYGWDTQKSIGNIEQMKKTIKFQSLQDYISNLKLDI